MPNWQPAPLKADKSHVTGSFAFRGCLQLLAPLVCPGCDLVLRAGETGFCAACWPLIEEVRPTQRPPADHAAAFIYGGPLADAVCRLKYQSRAELAPTLGMLLSHAARPWAGLVDVVIPMPLHPRRLRSRGFNQAALLAKPVARNLGIPLDAGCLRRIRDTPEQAGLPRQQRTDNVTGAFRARIRPGAERVLLVDDVRTTGATLASASRALLEAGFSSVCALALARADL